MIQINISLYVTESLGLSSVLPGELHINFVAKCMKAEMSVQRQPELFKSRIGLCEIPTLARICKAISLGQVQRGSKKTTVAATDRDVGLSFAAENE